MGQFVIMKKFDRIAQLISNMTNSFQWVGLVTIILLKYRTKNFIIIIIIIIISITSSHTQNWPTLE